MHGQVTLASSPILRVYIAKDMDTDRVLIVGVPVLSLPSSPTQISNSKSSPPMVCQIRSYCRSNGKAISAAVDHCLDREGRDERDKFQEQLLLLLKQKPLLVHRPVRFDIVEELKLYSHHISWQHEERRMLKEQSLNDVVKFSDTSASAASPKPKSDSQHHRKIGSVCKADRLKTMYNSLHMMVSTREPNAGQRMVDLFIIDSGSPFHCTGDRSLFSDDDYTEAPSDSCIYGASGKEMRVLAFGSIRTEKCQLQDVLYVPSLNKPKINKTIISVSKLTKLGYSVVFNFDGTTCAIIDKNRTSWTWQHQIVGEAHMEHGHYMLDYLRIDRAPVPTSPEGPGRLVKSFWKAVVTGWSTITERLSPRATRAQRPPV